MDGPVSYNLGFSEALECEPIELTWEGSPPAWLSGTLFRNGPGRFDRGQASVSHWFDGLAMLHSFRLQAGKLVYRSHFVRSQDFRQAQQTGRIGSPGFACDPCRDLFRKLASLFVVDGTDNTNINVIKQGRRYLALTELPVAMEFDPVTLGTLGPIVCDDRIGPGSTTAHPHQDQGLFFNQVLNYSARPSHRLFSQQGEGERQEFARIPVREAAYVHSFGLSPRWMVLTCCPFQVSPLTLLLRDRPFIENFSWKPEKGTRFHLAPRPDAPGETCRTLLAEPFFCFHHVNSFDLDDGRVVVDLIAYRDARIIDQLRLARLSQCRGIDFGRLRRYLCCPQTGTVRCLQESRHGLELPNIPYRRHNTKPYRYVYGVSADVEISLFYDRLLKLEVESDEGIYWHESACFPGEPVFVSSPLEDEEDAGVLLSVVLSADRARSFLLVLDATSMRELARAYLPAVVPHGFHGFFEAG